MWYVLCEAADEPALWAWNGLRELGLAPLELVTTEALAGSRRWCHRVGTGGASVQIELGDGRCLVSAYVRGTLNRLHWPASAHLLPGVAADRGYAVQEFAALYTSWLESLPGPMLNRPSPFALSGRPRSLGEWTWMARVAGLSTLPFRQSSLVQPDQLPCAERAVFVVGERVVDQDAPVDVRQACRRLALVSAAGLLGVFFATTPADDWTFLSATLVPDLRVGGAPLLDALLATLERS